jgi:peptidoglycan/LPS O-acetylase OafA/YrhL
MSRERLKALDGLRGVAAISVMISHAGLTALRFRHGYLAVDLFFLLSGYVIAKCYEPALAGQPGSPPLGAGRYMLARFERLYPMLLLGGILGFGVFAVGMSDFVPANRNALFFAIVSQFFLLEPLSPTGYFIFNRVQWSIVSELTVNGAHAVALPKLNIAALCGIVSISIVGIVISVRDCGSLERTCSALAYPLDYSRVFFSFFAGVLIYRLKDLWSEKIPRISFAILVVTA